VGKLQHHLLNFRTVIGANLCQRSHSAGRFQETLHYYPIISTYKEYIHNIVAGKRRGVAAYG
jgi:hypothetical protein